MLLAVFLTAGFGLAGAQASVMSAKMTTTSDNAMAMHPDADMTMSPDQAGDCKACPESADDDDNRMQCSTTCIAPVLAVLPQDLAVTTAPRVEQPSALPTPLLHGRSSLPDPSPPKSSDLI
ncbi:hypothetical protein GCM10010869_43080 [Mesorhizobium tianshanense]|uniref:CopL family metal-binding regulatory protein n=1 Tax=Mesorhizobium tianshanense TaxID=39844 RepID=A0A562NAY5_9HYPH|nr:hypothetical protein [Mesorhizobium tianshanense]TWI29329.1 hypothetical protein IQ26_05165 [Mesorhizobium tianshanense]GLS38712.1 hypothetical protein GCM10010869_43080 [Mesorhizobium tianshanense]